MSQLLGKTLFQPKFIKQIVIEHPNLSMMKHSHFKVMLYNLDQTPPKNILVFEHGEPKPQIQIGINQFKFGTVGSQIFLVRQPNEMKRRNFYQWRFAKVLAELKSNDQVHEAFFEVAQQISKTCETDNHDILKDLL